MCRSKGNGTQALVMPLNAASHAEDLAIQAGKPPQIGMSRKGRRRGWKGFYGSVHDVVSLPYDTSVELAHRRCQYSYPCEVGLICCISV